MSKNVSAKNLQKKKNIVKDIKIATIWSRTLQISPT